MAATLRLVFQLIFLVIFLGIASTFPTLSYAAGYAGVTSREQSRDALGSLSSAGEVYVNDSPAAAESAILPGDRVRTGATGTATFAANGKGTLRILPRSQVAFSGSDQFTAELEAGTIVSNSTAGADGVILRIGNYVVVSSVREQATTFRITRAQDGSFLVSCLGGSVGVLTLEGKAGQFLQGGHSLTVSEKQDVLHAPASAKRKSNFPTRWLVLGLAGAGTAAAVAAKLAHGGGGSGSNPIVTLP